MEQGSGYCRSRQERLSNQVPCRVAQDPACKSQPGEQMLTQHSWPLCPSSALHLASRLAGTEGEGWQLMEDLQGNRPGEEEELALASPGASG